MLFYEALFSLLCHIVRVEEKSRVVFIYMPLHHVQMCMFREITIWSLGGK